MEVPKQEDIRNEQLELELFPEEATESPGQGQSEMTAEKEPEGKSSDERAIRNADRVLREDTMSFIVSYKTMEDAFRKVASNKGSAGMDGMTCEELMPYFHKHWQEIREALVGRTYKPTPVKRVEIPKDNGKTRSLGIPTVIDRGVQQAVATVLSWIYEPMFQRQQFRIQAGTECP